MYESNKITGQRQFDTAKDLYDKAQLYLNANNSVKFIHAYVDMQVKIFYSKLNLFRQLMLAAVLHQQDEMKQHAGLHLVIHLLLERLMDMEILILLKDQIQQMFFGNLFHHF